MVIQILFLSLYCNQLKIKVMGIMGMVGEVMIFTGIVMVVVGVVLKIKALRK